MVLVLQVWCCDVKHALVTRVVIMIMKDTAVIQVLFIIYLFCAWNTTTVEINSGVHLLKSYISQVSLFTSGCLGLVILVLVLRIWSCLHHCRSLSAVCSTCQNHLHLLFLIITLTGFNPMNSLSSSLLFLSPTHRSNHTHFSVI